MLNQKALRVCAMAVAGVMVSHTAANASCGTASWYHEGARTANGEHYKPDGISAAHRTLPFGTRVLVTHKRSGRTVVVRINDRGPFIGGRIIDLSRGAKRVLGMDGLAPVCLTVLGRGGQYASADRPAKTRRARVARKNQVREVYRTVETSGRYDEDDAPGYSTRRAAEKRAAKRRAAARAKARARMREARSYEFREARNYEAREDTIRVANWPRS
jgi:rare lipoprotein A